ncbi:MAG TPA: glycosyltransferase family 4 protein [Pyrinomonadaceae bacterium]|jgi:glycosyltransferase involved in cell wall biosynthesis
MKVLLSHFAELGAVGGVETVVRRLLAGLTARGHSAGVVETTNGLTGKRLLGPQIPVWSVKSSTYPVYQRPRSWASFVRSAGQFLQVLRDFKPDVVNVHFPCTQALPVIGAHLLPHDWSIVVTLHGSEIRSYPFTEPHFKDWQRRLLQRADAVTAVSRTLLDDAVSLYPFIRDKAQVIHNGLEESWFADGGLMSVDERHAPYVLFVGRLHQVKGVDILLKAWAKARQQLPQTVLRIVGDGPEAAAVKALAQELGITGAVEFMGTVERERLAPLYRNAQLVVMPSRSEAFPLTLLEAGASGGLSLATRVGGVAEVIEDGRTGFLVEPESVEALADAITNVMRLTVAERARIKRAARERIEERFSEARIVSEYLQLFASTLDGSRRTSRRAS